MDNIQRHFTFILTEECNLNCSYCYEKKNRTAKVLEFETAKKIIDKEIRNKRFDILTVDLFGGEPFLAFEVMKRISEYLWENTDVQKINISTNGTLIHGKIKEWIDKNKHKLGIGLSLDGKPESHNINRCNSAKDIDLDFLLSLPDLSFKTTISKESLPNLYEDIVYLHSFNKIMPCNFAYGIDWSDKNNIEILSSQLKKLIEYYLNNPQIEECTLLDYPIQ